jgi:hypothetical protein
MNHPVMAFARFPLQFSTGLRFTPRIKGVKADKAPSTRSFSTARATGEPGPADTYFVVDSVSGKLHLFRIPEALRTDPDALRRFNEGCFRDYFGAYESASAGFEFNSQCEWGTVTRHTQHESAYAKRGSHRDHWWVWDGRLHLFDAPVGKPPGGGDELDFQDHFNRRQSRHCGWEVNINDALYGRFTAISGVFGDTSDDDTQLALDALRAGLKPEFDRALEASALALLAFKVNFQHDFVPGMSQPSWNSVLEFLEGSFGMDAGDLLSPPDMRVVAIEYLVKCAYRVLESEVGEAEPLVEEEYRALSGNLHLPSLVREGTVVGAGGAIHDNEAQLALDALRAGLKPEFERALEASALALLAFKVNFQHNFVPGMSQPSWNSVLEFLEDAFDVDYAKPGTIQMAAIEHFVRHAYKVMEQEADNCG